MLEKIEINQEILGLIIRFHNVSTGVHFQNSPNDNLQVARSKYPQGSKVENHIHLITRRKIESTQEFIYIEYGKARIDFFDKDQNFVRDAVLESGDSILLLSGGHGLTFEKDTQIIEVKQGPFVSTDRDKIRF
jgi:hypothetical protein